jgi:peptidoglycan LD-endopeptidase LytH
MGASGRAVMTVLALALLVGLAPVSSLADPLEEASAERARLQARLDAAARDLADIEGRVAGLEEERDRLTDSVAGQEEELSEVDERMGDRVRQVYKHGTTVDPVAVFLASDDPGDALDRAGAVQRLVHGDRAEAEELVAVRTTLRAEAERLAERERQLASAVDEQRELRATLARDLERAAELERRLRIEERQRLEREREQRAEERRRQRDRERATAPAATEASEASGASGASEGDDAPDTGGSGMACPIDQPRSFTDTWGEARSGGRQHRGTDILSPMGTPIRAITSGVWDIYPPGPSAGLWAILHGDDGNQYWYMHLQSHTVADGARVSAGQQTGTNGDTGNARGTPHLHFELHPGGGAAVNPYSLLRRVC